MRLAADVVRSCQRDTLWRSYTVWTTGPQEIALTRNVPPSAASRITTSDRQSGSKAGTCLIVTILQTPSSRISAVPTAPWSTASDQKHFLQTATHRAWQIQTEVCERDVAGQAKAAISKKTMVLRPSSVRAASPSAPPPPLLRPCGGSVRLRGGAAAAAGARKFR